MVGDGARAQEPSSCFAGELYPSTFNEKSLKWTVMSKAEETLERSSSSSSLQTILG